MGFTFKTNKSTGKYRSFYPDIIDINLKRKKVGYFYDREPYKINLMVVKDVINEDGNPNCAWKWITLKHQSNSINDCKKFLNDNFDGIIENLNLYQIEYKK